MNITIDSCPLACLLSSLLFVSLHRPQIHSRLHVLITHNLIVCIMPDVEEGEDSLESCTVLGKRHQGNKVIFPYCLRCNQDTPGHGVEECPLWKTCRWCLSTQHAHDDCPSPHLSCTANHCLVYFGHPNFGSYCSATLAGLLHHELEVAYQDAEWDNADTCYKGSDV